MKRKYRQKSSSRKSPRTTPRKIARQAEEQARLLQLPLSVEGLLIEAERSLHKFAVEIGRNVAQALLEDEVSQRCGPRYQHSAQRQETRYGHQDGYIVLAGQKLPVRKPRVRQAHENVPLLVENRSVVPTLNCHDLDCPLSTFRAATSRCKLVCNDGICRWPFTRLKRLSASNSPATHQRSRMSPSRQRFTRRVTDCETLNADSIGFVVDNVFRNNAGTCKRTTVNVSSQPSSKLRAAAGLNRRNHFIVSCRLARACASSSSCHASFKRRRNSTCCSGGT